MRSDANLLIIGGADDSSVPLDGEPSSLEDVDSFLTSILGEESDIDIQMENLELLDKTSTFDLFRWSLRRDFPREDCEEIDHPDVHNKIFEATMGMTHATARLAHTFCTFTLSLCIMI